MYNNNQNIKKTKLGGEAMDLKHLVSGTDIEGKKVTLTEKEVEFIGKAFGNWITKNTEENLNLKTEK